MDIQIDIQKGFRQLAIVISILIGIILFLLSITEFSQEELLSIIKPTKTNQAKNTLNEGIQQAIKNAKAEGKTDKEIWNYLLNDNESIVVSALSFGFTPKEIQQKLNISIPSPIESGLKADSPIESRTNTDPNFQTLRNKIQYFLFKGYTSERIWCLLTPGSLINDNNKNKDTISIENILSLGFTPKEIQVKLGLNIPEPEPKHEPIRNKKPNLLIIFGIPLIGFCAVWIIYFIIKYIIDGFIKKKN
jgi:hypothetical protein